ncbi:MAG: D-alanyl-D-alanine carboxypeptidase [Oscillospiraceae bacterium]|nr:D-alanyl-D-alanine carboxypeptidase [Oscillospiraceae bacterium]
MKKFLSVCMSLLLVCCLCTSLCAGAVQFTPSFEIRSAAGLLINLDTDEVLYQKNADTQYMPGSLVQVMAAVIVLENCTDLSMKITADPAIYSRYSETEYPDDLRYADIMEGDTLTVEELLYAMMLTSSYEAAVLLANQIGNGSVDSFVKMMNDKADVLGCTQTTFTNVTGVYDVRQKTTANDMALITKYALTLSKFSRIATEAAFTPATPNIDNHEIDWTWTHSNTMMQESSPYYLEGVKGIKTANLTMQGRNIVCEAARDGSTFLLILLAAPFSDEDGELQYYHLEDARALLDWVFTHFSYQTILSENTELGQISVKNGDGVDYVLVRPEKSYMTLWNDTADMATVIQDVELQENVSAPVKQGEKLGVVTLKFAGEDIAKIDLVATSAVELSAYKYYLTLIQHFPETEWMKRAILFSILFCAIYIVLCIYAHILHTQRRKTAPPVHLKPNSAAAKREARPMNKRPRKK